MQFWSFASGSSGNCYLIESEGTRLLVECGRPVTHIVKYLATLGVDPCQLDGILLTHAHGDHCRSARDLSDLFEVPVFASAGTLAYSAAGAADRTRAIQALRPFRVGEIEVTPFPVPHDCAEPLAFRFESNSGRACFLTDLGWVPASTQAHLNNVDLLVVEANYDPRLLQAGEYPPFLKQRVASAHGHLSNLAAARAITACGDRAPSTVWLAHLSENSNTAGQALRTVGGYLRRNGLGHIPLRITRHRRPSLHWNSAADAVKQLALF
jgi:phosphoribosyl 1,2-cyclic phosphodiesterase